MTFPIKGILKLTGDLLRRSWLPLVLVTLVSILPTLAFRYGNEALFHSPWRDVFISPSGFGPTAWAFIAISWFARGFHMGAVTEIALRTAASKPIRPRRLLLSATVNALPILLLQALLGFIITVGSLLLVVPGLFLGAAFSVVAPTYICEGENIFEAFRRSFKLTSPWRLSIGALWFAIILVEGLLTGALLSAAISMESDIHQILPTFSLPPLPSPAPISPFFMSPLGMVLTTIASQVYAVALMVLNVAIYLGLRFHKTASADNVLAAIFE